MTVGWVPREGISLEAWVLVAALREFLDRGEATFVISPELKEALEDGESGKRPIRNLARVLKKSPATLVVGEPCDDVLQALEGQEIAHVEHLLPEDDMTWVKENGARIVYTDGSVNTEEHIGGWGWYVDEALHDSGMIEHFCGSMAAECYAALSAFESLEGPLRVVSDCDKLLRSTSAALQALGLTDPAYKLREISGTRVRFTFVKGHGDHEGNIAADRLAVAARKRRSSALAADSAALAEHINQVEFVLEATREHVERQRARESWVPALLWIQATLLGGLVTALLAHLKGGDVIILPVVTMLLVGAVHHDVSPQVPAFGYWICLAAAVATIPVRCVTDRVFGKQP